MTATNLTIDHDSQLTQAHYDALAKAVQRGHEGDIEGWEDQPFDGMGETYGASKNIIATRDTLNSFDGSHWREAEGRDDFEIDGCQCIHWESAQATKGQPRRSVTVVDFGGLRLIYQV